MTLSFLGLSGSKPLVALSFRAFLVNLLFWAADCSDFTMSVEPNSKEEPVRTMLSCANFPALVDSISQELLDHLTACRTCLAVFAAQQVSLEKAGCIEGRRIVSQSQVNRQEGRSNLTLRHFTDETLDDYLFDRLTWDQGELLEGHVSVCSQCLQKMKERAIMITCLKAVFGVCVAWRPSIFRNSECAA